MKTFASVADLAAIRARIALVRPTDKRRWGAMSVDQMLCHVTDSFSVPLGERAVTPPHKVPRIPVPLYRWLALNFPTRWPQGVPTPPEIDQQVRGTAPAAFEADRIALLAKLDDFVRHYGPLSPHPIFAAMTTTQWMRWGYLHTDHHLRQFGR